MNQVLTSCCGSNEPATHSVTPALVCCSSQLEIRHTTSTLTPANRWDHILARWAVRRGQHRVEPGLYSLGSPIADAPVFVSANYTLSFDALRSALRGVDCYILVLDTHGINVWCAAGKRTFGTDEVVRRIEITRLPEVVSHRVLILPQLGASGVAAHEVENRSGFKVEYGPVRAQDLSEYLRVHQATPDMRRVHFGLWDRLILIPVEVVQVALPTLVAALMVSLFSGRWAALATVMAVLAGSVLFPILLPWLPTAEFSTKGLILGTLVALPFGLRAFFGNPDLAWWLRLASALTYWLPLPAVTGYLALNFTGSTPFTSRTGVRREIFTYIPLMASMFGVGIALVIVLSVVRRFGGQ